MKKSVTAMVTGYLRLTKVALFVGIRLKVFLAILSIYVTTVPV